MSFSNWKQQREGGGSWQRASCPQATEERWRRGRAGGGSRLSHGSEPGSGRRSPGRGFLSLSLLPSLSVRMCSSGFCSAAAALRVLAAGSVKHVVSSNCSQWSGLSGSIVFLGRHFIESSVFSARISSHYIPYNS